MVPLDALFFLKKISTYTFVSVTPNLAPQTQKNVLEYLLLENLLLPFNREVWTTVVVTFQSHILGSISLAR